MVTGILGGYTEHTGKRGFSATVMGAMDIFLRLTGTVTLLIGLEILSPYVYAAKAHSLSTNIPSNTFLVSFAGDPCLKNRPGKANKDYIPPDNGGPSRSQGSGTR